MIPITQSPLRDNPEYTPDIQARPSRAVGLAAAALQGFEYSYGPTALRWWDLRVAGREDEEGGYTWEHFFEKEGSFKTAPDSEDRPREVEFLRNQYMSAIMATRGIPVDTTKTPSQYKKMLEWSDSDNYLDALVQMSDAGPVESFAAGILGSMADPLMWGTSIGISATVQPVVRGVQALRGVRGLRGAGKRITAVDRMQSLERAAGLNTIFRSGALAARNDVLYTLSMEPLLYYGNAEMGRNYTYADSVTNVAASGILSYGMGTVGGTLVRNRAKRHLQLLDKIEQDFFRDHILTNTDEIKAFYTAITEDPEAFAYFKLSKEVLHFISRPSTEWTPAEWDAFERWAFATFRESAGTGDTGPVIRPADVVDADADASPAGRRLSPLPEKPKSGPTEELGGFITKIIQEKYQNRLKKALDAARDFNDVEFAARLSAVQMVSETPFLASDLALWNTVFELAGLPNPEAFLKYFPALPEGSPVRSRMRAEPLTDALRSWWKAEGGDGPVKFLSALYEIGYAHRAEFGLLGNVAREIYRNLVFTEPGSALHRFTSLTEDYARALAHQESLPARTEDNANIHHEAQNRVRDLKRALDQFDFEGVTATTPETSPRTELGKHVLPYEEYVLGSVDKKNFAFYKKLGDVPIETKLWQESRGAATPEEKHLFTAFKEVFNVTVRVVENDLALTLGFDGLSFWVRGNQRRGDVVYVRSMDMATMPRIISHEVWHTIAKRDEKLTATITDIIMSDERLVEMVMSEMNTYRQSLAESVLRDRFGDSRFSGARLFEEGMGNVFAFLVTKREFWAQMQRRRPSIAKKLANLLHSFFRLFRNYLSKGDELIEKASSIRARELAKKQGRPEPKPQYHSFLSEGGYAGDQSPAARAMSRTVGVLHEFDAVSKQIADAVAASNIHISQDISAFWSAADRKTQRKRLYEPYLTQLRQQASDYISMLDSVEAAVMEITYPDHVTTATPEQQDSRVMMRFSQEELGKGMLNHPDGSSRPLHPASWVLGFMERTNKDGRYDYIVKPVRKLILERGLLYSESQYLESAIDTHTMKLAAAREELNAIDRSKNNSGFKRYLKDVVIPLREELEDLISYKKSVDQSYHNIRGALAEYGYTNNLDQGRMGEFSWKMEQITGEDGSISYEVHRIHHFGEYVGVRESLEPEVFSLDAESVFSNPIIDELFNNMQESGVKRVWVDAEGNVPDDKAMSALRKRIAKRLQEGVDRRNARKKPGERMETVTPAQIEAALESSNEGGWVWMQDGKEVDSLFPGLEDEIMRRIYQIESNFDFARVKRAFFNNYVDGRGREWGNDQARLAALDDAIHFFDLWDTTDVGDAVYQGSVRAADAEIKRSEEARAARDRRDYTNFRAESIRRRKGMSEDTTATFAEMADAVLEGTKTVREALDEWNSFHTREHPMTEADMDRAIQEQLDIRERVEAYRREGGLHPDPNSMLEDPVDSGDPFFDAPEQLIDDSGGDLTYTFADKLHTLLHEDQVDFSPARDGESRQDYVNRMEQERQAKKENLRRQVEKVLGEYEAQMADRATDVTNIEARVTAGIAQTLEEHLGFNPEFVQLFQKLYGKVVADKPVFKGKEGADFFKKFSNEVKTNPALKAMRDVGSSYQTAFSGVLSAYSMSRDPNGLGFNSIEFLSVAKLAMSNLPPVRREVLYHNLARLVNDIKPSALKEELNLLFTKDLQEQMNLAGVNATTLSNTESRILEGAPHVEEGNPKTVRRRIRYIRNNFLSLMDGILRNGQQSMRFGEGVSVDHLRNELHRKYVTPLAARLETMGLLDAFYKDQITADIVLEIEGFNTGNEQAAQIGKLIKDIEKNIVMDMQEQGVPINWVEGYSGFRMVHDHQKIRGNEAQWREFLHNNNDWSRTFEHYGRREEYRDADNKTRRKMEEDFLTGALESIQADRSTVVDFYDDPHFSGTMSRRLASHRAFHLVPGASYKYDVSFGSGRPGNAIMTNITRNSDALAVMRLFGPAYRDNFNSLINSTGLSSTDGLYNLMQFNRVSGVFRMITGDLDSPVNRSAAAIGTNLRNYSVITHLGLSGVQTITDIPSTVATLKWAGMSIGFLDRRLWRSLGVNLKETVQKPGDLKMDFMRAQGVGMLSYLRNLGQKIGADNLGTGVLSELSNKMMSWNLLETLTTTMQRTVIDLYTQEAAHNILNGTFTDQGQRFLNRYGIGREEIELLKKAIVQLPGEDVSRIDIRQVYNLDPELGRKWGVLLSDLMRQGSVEQDASSAAFTRGVGFYGPGFRSGTFYGEAARSGLQYNGFMLSVVRKAYGRILNGYGTSGFFNIIQHPTSAPFIHGISFIAASFAMAYVASVIKDLLKGREPIFLHNMQPQHMLRLIDLSGTAGLWGPLITSVAYNKNPATSLMSPMASGAVDLIGAVAGGQAGKAFDIATQNTPGASLPLIGGDARRTFLSLVMGDAFGLQYEMMTKNRFRFYERVTGQSSVYENLFDIDSEI